MNELSEKLFNKILKFARNNKLSTAWIATILIGLFLSIFPGDAVGFIGLPFMALWFITPYTVAKRKGKNPWKWAFLCAFLFPSWIILLSSKNRLPVNKRSPVNKTSERKLTNKETLGDFYGIMKLNNRQKTQLKRRYRSIRKMKQASDEDLKNIGFSKREISIIKVHRN